MMLTIGRGVMLALALLASAHASDAQTCAPPITSHVTTVEDVRDYFRKSGKTVLTLMGYSGAGYEDPSGVLARAEAVLARFDPRTVIVNIGATPDGIGAVYELAHRKGF